MPVLSPDVLVLRKARPYLRSTLAFLYVLRFGRTSSKTGIEDSYNVADLYLDQLEQDVKQSEIKLEKEKR